MVKTRRQLITLAVGAAWVSGAALLSDDGLQFIAFAFPGTVATLLSYAAISHHFRPAILGVVAAMAAWVSVALFVGKSDCCTTEQQYRLLPHYPANLAGDFVRLNALDGGYRELKTPRNVALEIVQLAVPGVLFGLVGMWWAHRRYKEKRERLDWEIEHSPVSQPFPIVSLADFGTASAPEKHFSFYCYCGMEVIGDDFGSSVRSESVACPACARLYDLARDGRRLVIDGCR